MSEVDHQLKLVSNSVDETYDLGVKIGEVIQSATALGLNGTLGSGKTKLTHGIVSGVTGRHEIVVSPTFTLCIPYSGRVDLWHLDAYRIRDDEEVYDLGLDEAVEDGNVIVIEWVDKIRELIPPLDLLIEIEHESEHQRVLEFVALTPTGVQLLMDIRKSQ